MRELTLDEVNQVNGGNMAQAARWTVSALAGSALYDGLKYGFSSAMYSYGRAYANFYNGVYW